VPLLPKPVIAFPTMKAFIVGEAAVRAEPTAKSTLLRSRIRLLLKKTSSFPLKKKNINQGRIF